MKTRKDSTVVVSEWRRGMENGIEMEKEWETGEGSGQTDNRC